MLEMLTKFLRGRSLIITAILDRFITNGTNKFTSIITTTTPYGSDSALKVLASTGAPFNDNKGNGHLGGVQNNDFVFDTTKNYRYTCWFRVDDHKSDTTFRIWHGIGETLGTAPATSHIVEDLSTGESSSNPYNIVCNCRLLTPGTWYLLVAYIYAAGTPVRSTVNSGIYTAAGVAFSDSTMIKRDYRFIAGRVAKRTRSFFNYGEVNGLAGTIYNPRLDILNGQEPTLAQIRAGKRP